jgi:TadE-like protein
MRPTGAQATESESGQASVEFLGVLPVALLLVLAAWQLALAGQAGWLAANAARVGARAQAVGRDPDRAARSALPSYLEEGVRVTPGQGGEVRVRVRVPLLVRTWHAPLRVGASAAMEPQ